MSMGELFITFLLVVIGLALTPTIQQSVADVTGTGEGNLSGSAKALAILIPMFWVIFLLGVIVAAVYIQFKVKK